MVSTAPTPLGAKSAESLQPRIIAVNVAGLSLVFVVVSLRFLCRRLSKTSLSWDDWLILPALFSVASLCFITIAWAVPNGLGKHVWAAPHGSAQAASDYAKFVLVAELTYTVATVFTKFSILCLYLRIFHVRKIRLPIYILMGIVSAWGISVIIVALFQCIPLAGLWDPTIKAVCNINKNIFFEANSIPTIVSASAIIILPWPYMWRLNLSRKQKLAAMAIFSLGSSTIVIGIIRLVFVFASTTSSVDPTWDFVNSQIWTVLEVFICISCSCLPTLRPVPMPREVEPESIRILEISDPRMIKPTAKVVTDMTMSTRRLWELNQANVGFGESFPKFDYFVDLEAGHGFPFPFMPIRKVDQDDASKSSIFTVGMAAENIKAGGGGVEIATAEVSRPVTARTSERALSSRSSVPSLSSLPPLPPMPGTIGVRREFNVEWDMVSVKSLGRRPASSGN